MKKVMKMMGMVALMVTMVFALSAFTKESNNTSIRKTAAEKPKTPQTQNTANGHEYVDLGLPSGTLWATCNVGATKPEEYGLYFAWGETKGYPGILGKDKFLEKNYKFGEWDRLTKYTFKDKKKELDLEDDAAYTNWGSDWQMPSAEQIEELLRGCTWTWTTYKGVMGHLGKGKNGKSIFFPAAGWFGQACGSVAAGVFGGYWSRSLFTDDRANFLEISNSYGMKPSAMSSNNNRCNGLSVRPVRR